MIDAMKQALEALEELMPTGTATFHLRENAITALRQAIQEATLQEISDIGQEIESVARKYSIEQHGGGYAIYYGRDWQHHGANIGHLTEVTPATIKLIEDALNQKTWQAEKQDADEWYENALWGEHHSDCVSAEKQGEHK